MEQALTYADVGAAVVYRARVLDVDSQHYTVTVHAENLKKPLSDLSFATPYQHMDNGEGIYFMPEVGSICWVCEPSDGSKATVMAWAAANDEGDFRANKHDLNPGDIYFGTRDENCVILRRGGVVQIMATPLSQRLFLPINNTIRDLCEQYSLQTLGGDLSWTVDIPQKTKDGTRPTLFRLAAREFANDPKPVAVLEIGSHPDDTDAILSLVLNDSGAAKQTPKITLTLKKNGEVKWKVEGKVEWKFMKTLQVDVEEDATLHSKTTATLQGDQKAAVTGGIVAVTSKTGAVAVDAKSGMTVTSGSGPALTVGKGTTPVMLAPQALITWLTTHTHGGVTTGSGASGPPVGTLPEVQSADLKSS